MKKHLLAVRICMTVLLCWASGLHAELEIKGFGSIVGAKVFDGDGYVAEYPNVGIYDKAFDMGEESRLGIQLATPLSQKARATLQVMSRGNNDFEPEVDWLYLTYYPRENIDVQFGRMRLPVYVYSEYMDVGMAYSWVRIPADTYSLDLVNFNGVRLNYLTGSDDIPLRLSVFYGSEENRDTELMSYLFPPGVSRNFKDLWGVVIDGSYDFLNLRVSYTEAKMEDSRTTDFNIGACRNARHASSVTPGDSNFYGSRETFLSDCDVAFIDVAMTLNFGDFSVIGEFNDYYPFYESFFGSFNYRIGANTFYLLYSKFDLDGPFEVHDTQSIGLRTDISGNMAIKFDISVFNDDGFNPFIPGAQPVYKYDDDGDGIREKRPKDGDAGIFTIAFDFLF